MPTGKDIIHHVRLNAEDTLMCLTAYFSGGPIVLIYSDGAENKVQTFAADPFYRRQDHYVVSGALLLPTPAGDVLRRTRIVTALFTNVSPSEAHYRLEVSSPRRLNFQSAGSGADSPARLLPNDATTPGAGTVAVNESVQYVIVIEHP